jgi:hypothetical protein
MKILDGNFRKELYKNLLEIGYEKQEAQKIVGVKYFKALKESLTDMFNMILQNLEHDEIEPLDEPLVNDINNSISELKKMKEYLS